MDNKVIKEHFWNTGEIDRGKENNRPHTERVIILATLYQLVNTLGWRKDVRTQTANRQEK